MLIDFMFSAFRCHSVVVVVVVVVYLVAVGSGLHRPIDQQTSDDLRTHDIS